MKKTAFYIFVVISLGLFSQKQQYIDSLETVIKNDPPALNKAKTLNLLSKANMSVNLEKTKKYALQGIELAKINGYTEDLGNFYNTIGTANAFLGNNADALFYFDTAVVCFQKISNTKGLISAYNNSGAVFYTRSNYKKALEYYYKTLSLSESLKDKSGIADALTNILGVNFVLQDYSVALKNGHLAYALFIELKDKESQAFICHTIASVYEKTIRFDSAYKYIRRSISLYQQLQNKDGIADNYVLLAYFDRTHTYNDSAIDYLNKATELYNQTGNLYKKANTQQGIASIYYDTKNYDKSLSYCLLLLKDARSINSKALERDALELLMKNYSAKKMHENAMFYALQLLNIKDTILNEKNLEQISELNTKYETERKEKENILLKQDNKIQELEISKKEYLIYIIAAIALVILLSAFLFIRQYRLISLQKNTELKQRLLRNQMNPHFIFNSLIAIQSYIYKNEPKEAGKYLSSFAKLVRFILENSTQNYIPLIKEINWLENYLQLQMLRFETKFDYLIEVDENIDPSILLIPPMLTQPFIENALEHGISNIDYKGSLHIRFKIHQNSLITEVRDNGIGFKVPQVNTKDKEHVSLAISITRERLMLLNKGKNAKIVFKIDQIQPKGTLILFEVPLLKN